MQKTLCGLAFSLALAVSANAGFLDLTALTIGPSGDFSGTLNGIAVRGSITSTPIAGFVFDAVDATYFGSTLDNTSPQYSYSSVFNPTISLTDRVGYTSLSGARNDATITITFASAITNPVIHVANLDNMQYDFSPTAGLGSLVLLNGNGGGADGIQVVGSVISDADNSTAIVTDPAAAPPTTGPRSAYGSIRLVGTFTSLVINVANPSTGGDGGSFTLSADVASVPEPATFGSVALGIAALAFTLRRRRTQRS